MSSPDRDVRLVIRHKIRELHAQIAVLDAALAVLGGKQPRSPTEDPTRPAAIHARARKDLRGQFDAMMTILSARKDASMTPVALRDALRAQGQFVGNDLSVNSHLKRAVKLGYAVKRADGYRASPTIQKITQQGASPPKTKRAHVNGARSAKPDNYGIVLKVLRESPGPQKPSVITAAANQHGGTLRGDAIIHHHLKRGIKAGLVKKSADGYEITEKGPGA